MTLYNNAAPTRLAGGQNMEIVRKQKANSTFAWHALEHFHSGLTHVGKFRLRYSFYVYEEYFK